MNKKGSHFDTVMSWVVFAVYILFIFIITSVVCECSSCEQKIEATDSSSVTYGFDSLQASEELAGYLRTPLFFGDWGSLENEIDRVIEIDYKKTVHTGVGILAEYEPFFQDLDSLEDVKKFLKENPELYKKPSGQYFLTYGDFLTRLSSYKQHPQAVYAFRLMTAAMFSRQDGRKETCSYLIEPQDIPDNDDGTYTLPFIFLYFEEDFEEEVEKLNEVESPGPDSNYEKHLSGDVSDNYRIHDKFKVHHEDTTDCAYSDESRPCWSTGKFYSTVVRVKDSWGSYLVTDSKCSKKGGLIYQGFKIIPGSNGEKIGVTLLTQTYYREALLLENP